MSFKQRHQKHKLVSQRRSQFLLTIGSETDKSDASQNYDEVLNQILAYFIFRFESDGSSRCEHTEGSNIVELNDYEILEIMPNSTAKYGYTYTVKPCISAAIGHQFKGLKP